MTVQPAFTFALYTCCSSLALTCLGPDSLIYHSTAKHQCACLLYVFDARPLIAFVALADQSGVENNWRPQVRSEATAAIFFLHMPFWRVGALVPVCGFFHRLSTSYHASPSTQCSVCSACLLRCSAMRGIRPTNWLCLACRFRLAINKQSNMITGCKFQYLQTIASSHYSLHAFWCVILLLSVVRYATH